MCKFGTYKRVYNYTFKSFYVHVEMQLHVYGLPLLKKMITK